MVFIYLYGLMNLPPAFRHHRAVRAGGNGGLRHPLPDPPAQEAPPLAVDLTPCAQDQRVSPV